MNSSYGAVRVGRALADLAENPETLELSRERFDGSPPRYPEYPSGTPTEYGSPDARTEEELRLGELYQKAVQERDASQPRKQFSHQVSEEEKLVLRAVVNKTLDVPPGTSISTVARRNVKANWMKQGIWNNEWNDTADGCWKHEDFPDNLFGDDIKRRWRHRARGAVKRQSEEKREPQVSRPIHQFNYQLSLETERFLHGLGVKEGSIYVPEDINTKAYNIIKDNWIQRGIWDTRWLILPGMSWKHERPLEEFLGEDLIAYAREKSLLGQGNNSNNANGRNPSLANSPRTESSGRHIRFDLPNGPEKDKDDSAHWRKMVRYKKRQSRLMGDSKSSGELDSNSPPPQNEEEIDELDSKAAQQEEYSHSDGSKEDQPMLDSEPPESTKRTPKRSKRTTKGTRTLRRSSRPKGIVKKYKDTKKAEELKQKFEDIS